MRATQAYNRENINAQTRAFGRVKKFGEHMHYSLSYSPVKLYAHLRTTRARTANLRSWGGGGLSCFHTVEKWHFPNHVGSYCKNNCNPNDYDEVKEFNTVICEQKFKYIAKFKGMTHLHMSASTFNFMLLLLTWIDHEMFASPYRTEI